jgi:predicted  nucleic acid-binding Zn-ribbon protein
MLGNSKLIAELQEKAASLETQLASATSEASTANASLAKANADLQAALAKAGTLEGQISKLTADLEAANAKATDAESKAKAAEASITEQVNTRLASAGVEPIKRDASASESEGGKNNASSLTGRSRLAALFAKVGQK